MSKFGRLLAAVLLLGSAASSRALEPLSPTAMDEPYTYHIEVLQVTDIGPYEESYQGFLKTLADNDIALGKNLVVHREKIASDTERGGFWNRLWVYFQVRAEAQRIVRAKPDLVLTIGTAATKYARYALDDDHVPAVFTAVANPLEIGATSFRDAGPGLTGATLYTDIADSLKTVKEIFPEVQKIGMVHSDDENGVAHVQITTLKAAAAGITVSSRQVTKNDGIVPALKQLYQDGAGVQMFAVPLDTYYGLRNFEPARDLGDFALENRIPVVSLALARVPGAMLYIGADFATVGGLSAQQALKILKRHVKPDVLPILKQDKPTVLIDPERLAALKVALPQAILERKSVGRNGFWEIGAAK
ncbi:MAG TPA: ABC transporter substrate binding protein [Albitalea sp.]|nr:ABC transporter substrate binding protein [Albitalea sp.]